MRIPLVETVRALSSNRCCTSGSKLLPSVLLKVQPPELSGSRPPQQDRARPRTSFERSPLDSSRSQAAPIVFGKRLVTWIAGENQHPRPSRKRSGVGVLQFMRARTNVSRWYRGRSKARDAATRVAVQQQSKWSVTRSGHKLLRLQGYARVRIRKFKRSAG
jgi:hypothetical protein